MRSDPEHYECLDCYYVGLLTTHGRCQRCGSYAVITVEKIQLPQSAQAVKGYPCALKQMK